MYYINRYPVICAASMCDRHIIQSYDVLRNEINIIESIVDTKTEYPVNVDYELFLLDPNLYHYYNCLLYSIANEITYRFGRISTLTTKYTLYHYCQFDNVQYPVNFKSDLFTDDIAIHRRAYKKLLRHKDRWTRRDRPIL